MNDLDRRIKHVMANAFNVSVEDITEAVSVRSIPQWKGSTHVKLVENLEREFHIRFEESEVETLVNYKIVQATVKAYLDQ